MKTTWYRNTPSTLGERIYQQRDNIVTVVCGLIIIGFFAALVFGWIK